VTGPEPVAQPANPQPEPAPHVDTKPKVVANAQAAPGPAQANSGQAGAQAQAEAVREPKTKIGARKFPEWAWGVIGLVALAGVFAAGNYFASRPGAEGGYKPQQNDTSSRVPSTTSQGSPASSETAPATSTGAGTLQPPASGPTTSQDDGSQPAHFSFRTAKQASQAAGDSAIGTWTDPATGLMWTMKDKENGGHSLTWQQAVDYCRNMRLAGDSDWRLPTIGELRGIYDAKASVRGHWMEGGEVIYYHVKGNLLPSGWDWSSSQANGEGQIFDFEIGGGQLPAKLDMAAATRAFCVRGAKGDLPVPPRPH
jgi:hypothetical protein